MNTLERTTGNAYTKDKDYAALNGRVVQTFTTVKYCPAEGAWIKKTIEYIDIGRGDAIPARDADTAIADDGTDVDGNARHVMGMHSKTALTLEAIHSALEDRPLSTRIIAEMVGLTVNQTKHLLLNHPQGLTIMGRTREGHVYGLTGYKYDTVIYYQGMEKIVEYIKAHGPSPISVLCRELRMAEQNFHKALASNPGVLNIVGTARNPGRKSMRLWGLVGVHDRGAA